MAGAKGADFGGYFQHCHGLAEEFRREFACLLQNSLISVMPRFMNSNITAPALAPMTDTFVVSDLEGLTQPKCPARW